MKEADGPTTDALARGAAAMVANPSALEPQDYRDVSAALRSFLARRYPWFSPTDLEDVSASAIERMLRASRAGRIDPNGRPAGYLLAIARNAAVSQMRHVGREVSIDEPSFPDPASDDETASAAIEREVTARQVREALAAARKNGDTTLFRAATYFLDEAQLTGHHPSYRQVAEALGLSHTGVAKALQRLRAYLPSD